MNKIKKLKKLNKQITKFDKFITAFRKWKKEAKAKRRKIIKGLSETELLLYGQENGWIKNGK